MPNEGAAATSVSNKSGASLLRRGEQGNARWVIFV